MSARARALPWWRDERFDLIAWNVQSLIVFDLGLKMRTDCTPHTLLTEGFFPVLCQLRGTPHDWIEQHSAVASFVVCRNCSKFERIDSDQTEAWNVYAGG